MGLTAAKIKIMLLSEMPIINSRWDRGIQELPGYWFAWKSRKKGIFLKIYRGSDIPKHRA